MGVLRLSLICYALLYVHSNFSIILKRNEKAGCFAFIALKMSCYCQCSVALPHSDIVWSAVCDCGIS